MTLEDAKQEICDLWLALDESVKLQSHYAQQLNNYDGGGRMEFKDGQAFMDRLIDLGKIPTITAASRQLPAARNRTG
jgi:hypothetical protein